MTTREGTIFMAGGPCMFCRTLHGKPLTVPPHPLLTLVDTDVHGNGFHCANCKLGWRVELDDQESWWPSSRDTVGLISEQAQNDPSRQPPDRDRPLSGPIHLRIVGR